MVPILLQRNCALSGSRCNWALQAWRRPTRCGKWPSWTVLYVSNSDDQVAKSIQTRGMRSAGSLMVYMFLMYIWWEFCDFLVTFWWYFVSALWKSPDASFNVLKTSSCLLAIAKSQRGENAWTWLNGKRELSFSSSGLWCIFDCLESLIQKSRERAEREGFSGLVLDLWLGEVEKRYILNPTGERNF